MALTPYFVLRPMLILVALAAVVSTLAPRTLLSREFPAPCDLTGCSNLLYQPWKGFQITSLKNLFLNSFIYSRLARHRGQFLSVTSM